MMEQKNNMLPIGTLLRGGTYRVTIQLKSGGFGNTYVVENVHFGETYAMKEFFMQGVSTRNGTTVSISIEDNAKAFYEQKEKFKKEAKRIRKLNHPNIVKIHDLFEDNGTCYYIMDFIDGESLEGWIKSHGAMPETEALRVLNLALDALDAVHAAGFAHLDVTPRNIMRNKNGNVFLIDFGASKQIASSELRTLTGTAMPYSPGYAPTEQMNKDADRIGPWTDLYALGATMFRLLTAQRPPSSSEVVSYAMNGADPFHFTNDITESTQSLIKWMMHPAIERRPQSVENIRKMLRKEGDSVTSQAKDENATVYDDDRIKDVEMQSIVTSDDKKEADSKLNENEEKYQEEYDKSSVSFFNEGLARVKGFNGKFGFIDQSGKLVIPCQWEAATMFSDGMAEVKNIHEKWGYIDTTGKNIIPCKWITTNPFSNGVASVQGVNGQWINIEKSGNEIKSYIEIKSDPKGASVNIDGKWIGATPNKFEVEPGRHEVKVANGAGWSVYTQTVELVKGQTIHVFATLEQKKTFIDVRSNPKGATVYIDDRWCGTTPIKYEVAPGKHEIKLANEDGWRTYTRAISVEQGNTEQVIASLTKKRSKIKNKIEHDSLKTSQVRILSPISTPKTTDKNKVKVSNRQSSQGRFNWIVTLLIIVVATIICIVIWYEDGDSLGAIIENKSKKESFCPDGKHPHAIDLGLPSGTKWACCNVGASKPEDLGYYVVGENLSNYEVSKNIYGTNSRNAENAKMKDNWVLPTKEQCKEIFGCDIKSRIINGKEGVEVIGRNQNRIFIPAAGVMHSIDKEKDTEYRAWCVGEECTFWTSQKSKKNSFGVLSVSLTYVPDGEEAPANYTTDDCEDGLIIQNCEYALPIRPVINSIVVTR